MGEVFKRMEIGDRRRARVDSGSSFIPARTSEGWRHRRADDAAVDTIDGYLRTNSIPFPQCNTAAKV